MTLNQTESIVQISVQNKGELISQEDQNSLFQQFRQGVHAKISAKKGWGIGLTLVCGVAEAHVGSVTVQSDDSVGTLFIVNLPISPEAK